MGTGELSCVNTVQKCAYKSFICVSKYTTNTAHEDMGGSRYITDKDLVLFNCVCGPSLTWA